MIAILQTELVKLFSQKRTYYGLAAILVIELLIMIGAWVQGTEILDVLLENLTDNFIMSGSLLNGHLVLYIVLNSLWFNLPLIVMIIVSGLLTSEYKDKTIQTVLLQSVNKRNFILAKYGVALVFTLLVVALLFTTASLLAYSFFGTGDLITYLNGLNFFESGEAFNRIAWAFLLGTLLMICYSFLSITLAVFFKDQTVTWIICAFVLIINGLLVKMDLGFMNYWFFSKVTDTWQYFFYFEVPWPYVWHNGGLLIFYALLIATVGVWRFVKKDVG
ncbi:ABC transporter permease [Roseivirga pacifica]|uniref:ABC transporter permease n=1 Tax=Roseivirga pacifica TaxID=1267423 RepID=UPI00227C8668|nr:ABC transporter permease [Roseivirga pacifica]